MKETTEIQKRFVKWYSGLDAATLSEVSHLVLETLSVSKSRLDMTNPTPKNENFGIEPRYPNGLPEHMDVEAVVKEFDVKFIESFCNKHEIKPCTECGNVKDFIRSILTTQATQHEESLRFMAQRLEWQRDRADDIMEDIKVLDRWETNGALKGIHAVASGIRDNLTNYASELARGIDISDKIK